MLNFPFPAAALTTDDMAEIIDNTMIGRTIRAAIGETTLGLIGARGMASVPGTDRRGGLAFHARIPNGDSTERVGVLVSLTLADAIDIDVNREDPDHSEHSRIRGIYTSQLSSVIRDLAHK